MKRSPVDKNLRELPDTELLALSRAVGNTVRAQTPIVSGIVETNLKAAFAARRKQAIKLLKSQKTVAA